MPELWRGRRPQVSPFQRGFPTASAQRQANPMATRNSTRLEMWMIQVATVRAFSGSGLPQVTVPGGRSMKPPR